MNELSTSEAARLFDVHPVMLLQLIACNRLKARKAADGRWRITRRSLEAWNAKRLARRAARQAKQAVRDAMSAAVSHVSA